MASDWKSHKVGELADSISVTHPFDKKRLIFLNTSDILRGKVLHNSYKDIGSLPGQAKKTIKKDDILLSEIRPANGRYAFIDFDAENYVVSMKLMVIRAREKIIPKFLFYFLTNKSITNWLQHLAESRSGTFPQITFDQIADLNVKLPNRDEQEKIIAYIDPIDEKIELNRQMNATLEKIGQALFKHWFIDFEFPNGKGKPYNSSGGKMVDSELGKIPKGWEAGRLGDICEITMGQSPPGSTYNESEDGVCFYQGITDFGFRFPSRRMYCTEPTRFAQGDDVLLSVRAPVGSLNVAEERCAIGRGVAALRLKERHSGFLYYLLRATQSGWDKFEAEGTVFGSVTKSDVHDFKVVTPPQPLMTKFASLIEGLDGKIDINEKQSRTLSGIRDSLLPKLMSGQIRVPAG